MEPVSLPEQMMRCWPKETDPMAHRALDRWAIVFSLPFIAALGNSPGTASAQTPVAAIPEKAPANWNQADWTIRRNACIALSSEIAKDRAMTPTELAKLPKMNKAQARERFEQWKDCSGMVGFPAYGRKVGGQSGSRKAKASPLPTPTSVQPGSESMKRAN